MEPEIEKLIAVEPDVVTAACRALTYTIADLKAAAKLYKEAGQNAEHMDGEIAGMESALSQLCRSLPITAYLDLK